MRENSTQCLTLAVQWNVKIELKYLQAFVNDLKDRKSQHEVFCKKSVRQKAFLKFAAVLCICGKNPLKLPVKEVNFSNVSGLQHATLQKNVHHHRYFSRILTTQVENSFFVQHAQHQWQLLERFTYCC